MTGEATLTEAARDQLDWRTTTSSSNVRRVAFDPTRHDDDGVQRGKLYVDFGASLYVYDDVAVDEARALLAADRAEDGSVGRTLDATVKRVRECARVRITGDEQDGADENSV